MSLFCVISANSGSFRAHCIKVHVHYLIYWWVLVTYATLASAGISCRRVCLSVCPSVRLSVRNKSIFYWKRLNVRSRKQCQGLFWCLKSRQNSNGVTLNGGAKCKWDRLNEAEVAENGRLSTQNVVNLARSQVYNTERPRARWPWCSASRGFVSDSWSLYTGAVSDTDVIGRLLRSTVMLQ